MIIQTELQCEYCEKYFGKFVGRAIDIDEAIAKEAAHLAGCEEYKLRLKWRAYQDGGGTRMSFGDWKKQHES